ncbi:MAG: PQQ-dependent sugar dehydrogenase [Pseudohongiellaceae bacterium]
MFSELFRKSSLVRPARAIRFLTTLTILPTLGLAVFASAQDKHESMLHDFEVSVIAEGLNTPWGMNWLPNGDLLVTERPGRLRVVRNGMLQAAAVEGVPAVHAVNQGGLFDVLPHPEFASNRLLYLSFAAPMGNNSNTTVVRGRFENDRLSDVETIFQADTQGRDGHYGARMVFDNDGYLFLTIGDRQAAPRGDLPTHPAQDLSNHNGVLIRLHDDGRVPRDNPFVDERGAMPEVWSYGHRNGQGLALHPITGDLWENEHGPQGGDELNLIRPGANYGWPVIGYGVNYGVGLPIHNSQSLDGMEQPEHYWVPSIAVSGLMIYDGELFPGWHGDAFIGGLRGQQVARIDLDEDGKQVVMEETLLNGIGRVRDIRQGPDDAIYVATENLGILRLTPSN